MDYTPVLEYIAGYWPRIIRRHPHDEATLIGLPRPYLTPSDGAMFQEMYYWDSYFMALGVVGGEHEQVILDMTENMAYLVQRFGLIPNGSRYYFLSRSQPPFFTAMIWLAYEVKQRRGDADALDYLAQMMQVAEQEYATVWLGTAQPHHRQVAAGLSRYFDINYLDVLAACESGWDHSTRCEDRWLEHLPVDLNALLYQYEQDFARVAAMLRQPEAATAWRERAQRRAETMHRLMWDDDRGLFLDWDWKRQQRTMHPSLAAFYPLYAGLASSEQAARMVRDWLPRFEHPGGLVTTLAERAGRQWAYPNGWAPLQWLVTSGLERYGYTAEARRIMRAWCDNCATIFAATGCMWEKYAVIAGATLPEEGLYGSVPGFGWSNGVFVDFARRLAIA